MHGPATEARMVLPWGQCLCQGAVDGPATGAVDGPAKGAVDGPATGAVDGPATGAGDGPAKGQRMVLPRG